MDVLTDIDVDGKVTAKTFIGNLQQTHSEATTVPAVYVGSNNVDSTLLRVYSSDQSDTGYLGAYGYSLKYLGTGSGVANYLTLYADNQNNSTQNVAISVNQTGQVGIRTTPNKSYSLYVNGKTYFNGDIQLGNDNITLADGSTIGGLNAIFTSDEANYIREGWNWINKATASSGHYDSLISYQGQLLYSPDNSTEMLITASTATYPVIHTGNLNLVTGCSLGDFGTIVTHAEGDYLPLEGNAKTASKLASAKTIELTGAVTGSATFDGSANISIKATRRYAYGGGGTDYKLIASVTHTTSTYHNDYITFRVSNPFVQFYGTLTVRYRYGSKGDIEWVEAYWTTARGVDTSNFLIAYEDNGTRGDESNTGVVELWHRSGNGSGVTTFEVVAEGNRGGSNSDEWVLYNGSSETLTLDTDTMKSSDGKVCVYSTIPTIQASIAGNAATATALTSNAGSATQPVYFSSGKPVAANVPWQVGADLGSNYTMAKADWSQAYPVRRKVNTFASGGSPDSEAVGDYYLYSLGHTDSTGYATILAASPRWNRGVTGYATTRLYMGNFWAGAWKGWTEIVSTTGTQALTNKTYNGYTPAAACARGVFTLTGVTNLGWGTDNTSLPDKAALAYWNGQYGTNQSNLSYAQEPLASGAAGSDHTAGVIATTNYAQRQITYATTLPTEGMTVGDVCIVPDDSTDSAIGELQTRVSTLESSLGDVTGDVATAIQDLKDTKQDNIPANTYAPYNSAGYLPLSGGTLTGNLSAKNGLDWNNATWAPGGNITLTATANGNEWSFDIYRNSKTGTMWHVWDSTRGASMLQITPDNGKVKACYDMDVAGNLTVGGNLYVQGTGTKVIAETVQSENDFIELRYGNDSALTGYSGFQVLNTDGSGAYTKLVVGSDGIARLVTGTRVIADDSTITDTDDTTPQALLTRSDSMVDGQLLTWDNTNSQAVTTGKSTHNLLIEMASAPDSSESTTDINGVEIVRSDTGYGVAVGVGTGGTNHGLWSKKLGKWMVYANASKVYLNGNADTATSSTYATYLANSGGSTVTIKADTWTGGRLDSSDLRVWNQGWVSTSFGTDYGAISLWLHKESDSQSVINMQIDGEIYTRKGINLSSTIQNGAVNSGNDYAVSGGSVYTSLTDGTVTKVGTATVGGTTTPIYLNAGVPTAGTALGTMAYEATGDYLPITGGTLTGNLNVQSASESQIHIRSKDQTWDTNGWRGSLFFHASNSTSNDCILEYARDSDTASRGRWVVRHLTAAGTVGYANEVNVYAGSTTPRVQFESDICLNGNYNIRHSADTGYVRVQGGSAEGHGGRLVLSGKSRGSYNGCCELTATDGSNSTSFIVYPNQVATCSKGITASGTITGSGIISTNTSGSTTLTPGSMELSFSTPFIDFHFGKSTADYTSRIIETASGTLNLNGVTVKSNVVTATGGFVGNASSASKLATAHSIAVTGAVAGSASFDGSSDISIKTAKRSCNCGISDSGTTALWFKVAAVYSNSVYTDWRIKFRVLSGYSDDSKETGFLTIHGRSNNYSQWGASQCQWEYSVEGVNNEDFMLLHTNSITMTLLEAQSASASTNTYMKGKTSSATGTSTVLVADIVYLLVEGGEVDVTTDGSTTGTAQIDAKTNLIWVTGVGWKVAPYSPYALEFWCRCNEQLRTHIFVVEDEGFGSAPDNSVFTLYNNHTSSSAEVSGNVLLPASFDTYVKNCGFIKQPSTYAALIIGSMLTDTSANYTVNATGYKPVVMMTPDNYWKRNNGSAYLKVMVTTSNVALSTSSELLNQTTSATIQTYVADIVFAGMYASCTITSENQSAGTGATRVRYFGVFSPKNTSYGARFAVALDTAGTNNYVCVRVLCGSKGWYHPSGTEHTTDPGTTYYTRYVFEVGRYNYNWSSNYIAAHITGNCSGTAGSTWDSIVNDRVGSPVRLVPTDTTEYNDGSKDYSISSKFTYAMPNTHFVGVAEDGCTYTLWSIKRAFKLPFDGGYANGNTGTNDTTPSVWKTIRGIDYQVIKNTMAFQTKRYMTDVYKGTVANYGNLPTSGQADGDIYLLSAVSGTTNLLYYSPQDHAWTTTATTGYYVVRPNPYVRWDGTNSRWDLLPDYGDTLYIVGSLNSNGNFVVDPSRTVCTRMSPGYTSLRVAEMDGPYDTSSISRRYTVKCFDTHAYTLDASGNITHIDGRAIDAVNATIAAGYTSDGAISSALEGKVNDTGDTITGQLVLSSTTDVSGTAATGSALVIGTKTGAHLAFDTNEIMAKASATTVAPLYLNYDGGDVYLSGNSNTTQIRGFAQVLKGATIAGGTTNATAGLIINPTNGSYTEGVRVNQSPKGWAVLELGNAASSTAGHTAGTAWFIGRDTSSRFVVSGYNSTYSTGLLYGTYDSTNNVHTLTVPGYVVAQKGVQATGTDGYAQFRAVGGNYGYMIRNDGSATYGLMTASGSQYGTWTSARPWVITNSTGIMNINGNAATATASTTQAATDNSTNVATTAHVQSRIVGADSTSGVGSHSGWGNSTYSSNPTNYVPSIQLLTYWNGSYNNSSSWLHLARKPNADGSFNSSSHAVGQIATTDYAQHQITYATSLPSTASAGDVCVVPDTTSVGSATNPVYFSNGSPVACTMELITQSTVVNNAPTLSWGTSSTIGSVGGTALTLKMPSNPVTVTNSAPTLSWGATSTVGTVGGTALTVKMPSNPVSGWTKLYWSGSGTTSAISMNVTLPGNYKELCFIVGRGITSRGMSSMVVPIGTSTEGFYPADSATAGSSSYNVISIPCDDGTGSSYVSSFWVSTAGKITMLQNDHCKFYGVYAR